MMGILDVVSRMKPAEPEEKGTGVGGVLIPQLNMSRLGAEWQVKPEHKVGTDPRKAGDKDRVAGAMRTVPAGTVELNGFA